jgi:hypothetical protein
MGVHLAEDERWEKRPMIPLRPVGTVEWEMEMAQLHG